MKLHLILILLLTFSVSALAADVDGSADHPLVGRYDGSEIVYYKASAFDELSFLKAPHDYNALLERNATDDRSGSEWLNAEGRATEIRYALPTGRSSLEVLTNFEFALKSKGFTPIFKCNDKECLTGTLRDNYLIGQQLDPSNGISTAYSGHARYLLAELTRDEGNIYVSVLVGEDQGIGVAFIRVVEAKSMETNKIVQTNAADMQAQIASGGSINIYGILFDLDMDVVKPESKPTLDEIAKLLTSQPNLRLNIVGHTDNIGTAAYNLDLSSRRAATVAPALVGGYGIDPSRLTSSGAGLSQPVAPNDSDENRAKNRRVELKAQ